jgi:hypothetical protein
MPIQNKIEYLPDKLSKTIYQIAQETKIQCHTLYDLKNNPDKFTNKKVLETLIETYDLELSDLLEIVD